MNELLEKLASIQAIVDTFNPYQIESEPQNVAHSYEL